MPVLSTIQQKEILKDNYITGTSRLELQDIQATVRDLEMRFLDLKS